MVHGKTEPAFGGKCDFPSLLNWLQRDSDQTIYISALLLCTLLNVFYLGFIFTISFISYILENGVSDQWGNAPNLREYTVLCVAIINVKVQKFHQVYI